MISLHPHSSSSALHAPSRSSPCRVVSPNLRPGVGYQSSQIRPQATRTSTSSAPDEPGPDDEGLGRTRLDPPHGLSSQPSASPDPFAPPPSPDPTTLSARLLALATFIAGLPLLLWSSLLSAWARACAWRDARRLNKLESTSRGSSNPADHAAYLGLLNSTSPQAVIEWVEEKAASEDPPSFNPAIVAEYMKALVHTGRIDDYGRPKDTSGVGDEKMLELLDTLSHWTANTGPDRVPGQVSTTPLYVYALNTPASPMPAGNWLLQRIRSLVGWVSTFTLFVLLYVAGSTVVKRYGAATGVGMSLGEGKGLAGAGGGPGYAPKEYNKENVAETSQKKFSDVLGCDEAKDELQEVVEYLKHPERFTAMGAKLPKGVLLTGSPGTGKTLLAKAVAGEAGVPFLYRAGSEFEEMFVGVGSRRVRALFAAAKKKAPCIIFIDEIDAIGQNRKQWENHSRKTLNQMLTEMDGFEENAGVVVIAATNLPDSLDPALTRPGRFDRHVAVPLPDVNGRADILQFYLTSKPTAPEVDAKVIARKTPGWSGADLFNLVNEAALSAAKSGQEVISEQLIDEARDKILMGRSRPNLAQTVVGRRLTAYHEAGHAIAAYFTPGAKRIHKATIVPRGHSLGMVSQLGPEDEFSRSRQQYQADIDVAMGGLCSEEMIFGEEHTTSGASSDLKAATSTARHMVSDCGMSERIGPVAINEHTAPSVRAEVDLEIRKMLLDAKTRVRALLKARSTELHAVAKALLQHDTLTEEEIKEVLQLSQPPEESGGLTLSLGGSEGGGEAAGDAGAAMLLPDQLISRAEGR